MNDPLPTSFHPQQSEIELTAVTKERDTLTLRCSILENCIRYVEQFGERSGWPRVRQVCQMTLNGVDVGDVLRTTAKKEGVNLTKFTE